MYRCEILQQENEEVSAENDKLSSALVMQTRKQNTAENRVEKLKKEFTRLQQRFVCCHTWPTINHSYIPRYMHASRYVKLEQERDQSLKRWSASTNLLLPLSTHTVICLTHFYIHLHTCTNRCAILKKKKDKSLITLATQTRGKNAKIKEQRTELIKLRNMQTHLSEVQQRFVCYHTWPAMSSYQ